MGYTTDFAGEFRLNKALKAEHKQYLEQFCNTRRMARKPKVAEKFPDAIRVAAGLPIGVDGEFYVAGGEFKGQEHDASIVDYNRPPKTQPSLWCQWIPNGDGTAIEWDGGEKFYDYIEWIEYIIENFLKPWGYKLNGDVKWYGEDSLDLGIISITNNKVKVLEGRVVYEER